MLASIAREISKDPPPAFLPVVLDYVTHAFNVIQKAAERGSYGCRLFIPDLKIRDGVKDELCKLGYECFEGIDLTLDVIWSSHDVRIDSESGPETGSPEGQSLRPGDIGPDVGR